MKNILFTLFLLPVLATAQPKIKGIGNFRLGVTTPDSLNHLGFKEEEQSYVKGTLALPCDHIRTFTAPKTDVASVVLTNVVLFFYDNELFRVTCSFTDELRTVFQAQNGIGRRLPSNTFQLCTKENKAIQVWGEGWSDTDALALVVNRKGYNADCILDEGATLTITSIELSDLSSECNLRNNDPLIEEYLELLIH